MKRRIIVIGRKLVLRIDRRNAYAFRSVCLHIFYEIARVCREHFLLRADPAAVIGRGLFHPRRRAPGRGKKTNRGIARERLLCKAEHISAVMCNGKMFQRIIVRRLVVGIPSQRIIVRADGQTAELQPHLFGQKKLVENAAPARRRERIERGDARLVEAHAEPPPYHLALDGKLKKAVRRTANGTDALCKTIFPRGRDLPQQFHIFTPIKIPEKCASPLPAGRRRRRAARCAMFRRSDSRPA